MKTLAFSSLDTFVQKFLFAKYFQYGWGQPTSILNLMDLKKRITNHSSCSKLKNLNCDIQLSNEQKLNNGRMFDGKFKTPFLNYGSLPKECEDCLFKILIADQNSNAKFRPMCILFAGTGEHSYWKRFNVTAYPLLKHNISTIIVESPFYGFRKPKNQIGSQLNYVSDILIMGACLILESMVLLNYCEKMGFGPLGVSGVSMGGHMASLVAANWPKPLVLVPCLSWTTASIVFTTGVTSSRINWKLLEKQYFNEFKKIDEFQKLKPILEQTANELETVRFLQGLLDEFTHIKSYNVPVDTSLITSISALYDAYVPHIGCDIEEIWPNVTRKHLNTGHISGYMYFNSFFKHCIIESFKRAEEKFTNQPIYKNKKFTNIINNC